MKYVNYALLICIPVAVIAEFMHGSPVLIFAAAALGVVPMAGFMGTATEELAIKTGPRLGGLLNATLGNAAELIITIVALYKGAKNPELAEGLRELVKASITGSIIGNVLLIMGLSMLLGGIRHGVQKFDREQAGVNATMLILAVIAIVVPSLFVASVDAADHDSVLKHLTIAVAIIMLAVYGLGIFFSFRSVGHQQDAAAVHHGEPVWSTKAGVGVLIGTTVMIAFLSEMLVGAVEHVVDQVGLSEFFLGIILVPVVGNVAEHLVAVVAAWKNQMELSMSIAMGSSLQIALFVVPALVFISMAMGNPLMLEFNQFELITLISTVSICALIAFDGRSNWLEGVQLLGVYVILGLAFFFVP